MNIIWWLIVGFIAGLLARALVPGDDSMGIVGTTVLGLVGSLVGGFLGNLVSDSDGFSPSGLIGSIIGAIIALLIWRAMDRRAHA
ncbi:MAG TPA: GlsB/YeaQ/YmgE family stress response membrane protein [Actinomycetota bacterium]|nr:GlsB/YeaQ/YmgE family stress response membrane protein [Actinomycetota bacterium]